ncbi:MAG TPA: hypothetical protein VNW72_14315 [Chthoniobacterales bacterium]|jgi:hypothetical protein|nr:hypothetical protein [Chthoniobacterales bacterium]
MKKKTASPAGRVTLAALFAIFGFAFVSVALFPTDSQSAEQRTAKNRQSPRTPAGATAAVTPAPQDTGPAIGYENFTAPGVLVPVTTTEAGQQVHSVEWMGRNAGEPSIGSNWATGVAFFKSGLESLFVTFDDSCPINGKTVTWVNRASPTSVGLDSDPIGFTDRGFTDATGFHSRSFGGELTFLSPDTVKLALTDDDGNTWMPDQTGGLASAVDHETIGGGIYHSPIPTRPPGTVYPYAVYYCSQDLAVSLCSRSDDGGLTYGPSVMATNAVSCQTTSPLGSLHGHIKVSPADGTVYLPMAKCGANQVVVVSTNNGITWTVQPTPLATPGGSGVGSDPSVGVDANGRVYLLGAPNGNVAEVATSDDSGQTWQHQFDVGAIYSLKNIAFPAAVAGDAGRAAVSFYGSTTGTGDSNAANFTGKWHLYVAHTFDGGAHWTTTDATPNAPMQRSGLLRGGGANITRNLLDFYDMTIDKDGRVLVGYVNGCEGGPCAQAGPNATGNAYTTTATIARQSSGRRLLAAKDPANMTSPPGMPLLTQRRVGNIVHLLWSEADSGNLMINDYQVIRRSDSNPAAVIATIAGSQIGGTYTDTLAANDTTTYYYKVVAANSAGSSCGNNEVAAPFIGDTCSGLVIHRNDPTHPEANTSTATPASLLIDYIAVGEPPTSPGNFLFKMKVNDLSSVPINSRWRMMWNSFAAAGQQFYVGMTTGPSGPPTFEYGTLGDAGVPGVFVIQETTVGSALAASNFSPDGTISIYVPKSALGNPQIGDLLGAVGGRTFTGDTPGSPESKLERSNAFIDHTFVKAQSDNSYPPATYMLAGNNSCTATGILPIGAVSRKIHGSAGTFDIDLPLSGSEGIECRTGGSNGNHTIVVTFPAPVTVGSAACGGQAATKSINGSVVTVNCTGVPNAQDIAITLTGVSDGTNSGNVSIPMGVLLGDTTGNRVVNSSDISQTQSQSGQPVTSNNFREDVTANGLINSSDISLVQSQSGSALP